MSPHRLIPAALFGCLLLTGPTAGQSPPPVSRFEYDAEGRPTRAVLAPQSLALGDELRYDRLARVIQHLDPSQGSTEFAYLGAQAGLSRVTDPRRLVTSYGLDGFNQRRSIASPDRGAETQAFDAAGNPLGGSDARSVRTIRSHDALDRLTRVDFQQPAIGVEPAQSDTVYTTVATHHFVYDQTGPDHGHGIGRLTTQRTPAIETRYGYDAWGRVARIRQSVSHLGRSFEAVVQYQYDLAGGLIGIDYPSGRRLVMTREQGLPRSVGISLAAGHRATPIIEDIHWASWSRTHQAAQWQSWTWTATGTRHERRFDTSGRIEGLSLGPWARHLQYDDADRIVAYTHVDGQGHAVPSLDERFGYDANSRLSFASRGNLQWTYAYDANGNRIASNSAAGPREFSYGALSNRLVSVTNPMMSWTHDAQGNARGATPWTAYYDVTGQLSRIEIGPSSTQYLYDAHRRRVLKSYSSGVATVFVYGLRGELLGEYDLQSGAAIREYVWLKDTPIALVSFTIDQPRAEAFAIHTDHLDTPRLVTDRQGMVRWTWMAEPFGNEAALHGDPAAGLAFINLPLRMPGQYWDAESGLFYNHHRYYDPRVGRYMQSDPIGLAGGINTYSYVEGNPVSAVDPEGLRAAGGGTFQVPTTMLRQTSLPGFPSPVPSPGPQPVPTLFTPVNPFLGRQAGAQLVADSIGNIDVRTPSNVNWGSPLPRPPLPPRCTEICFPNRTHECPADIGCRVVCGPVAGSRPY